VSRLLAIDATNAVMRYAFAMLREGQASPAPVDVERVVIAVERALLECAAIAQATHAVAAFDSSGSWRRSVFREYKANRPPGATSAWTEDLWQHLAGRGWYCLAMPEFEADDLIATVVSRWTRLPGRSASVLSGDSDLLVLAGESCSVFQFGKRENGSRFVRCDPSAIAERYKIPSSRHLTLYKALVGEPGDNLPGVEGVGPVNARKLIEAYGTAEAILAAGVFARPKKEQLETMLALVALREDVPIEPINPALCRVPGGAR
jgi:DNA polymerase-1